MVKPEKRAKIENDLTKIAARIHIDKEPHVGFKTKFIFNMMKIMHAKDWDSSPVEKQYWEALAWLGKSRPWQKK